MPDKVEIKNAEQLRAIVASQIKEGEPTTLSLALESGEVQAVTLAPALTASLLEVLRFVSSGRGFRMIPVEAELTTQQAADLLNETFARLLKDCLGLILCSNFERILSYRSRICVSPLQN